MHGRSPAGPLIAEHRVIESMIGVMRAELESMAQSRSADSAWIEQLVESHVFARRLTGQLVGTAKEDRGFFRASMAGFGDTEQAQMLADFAEFDRTLIHERYRLLVDRLEKRGHHRIQEGGDHG